MRIALSLLLLLSTATLVRSDCALPADVHPGSPAAQDDEFDDAIIEENASCTASTTPLACCTGSGTGTCKWSWGNQGSATLTETGGYELLTTPSDASTNVRMRLQAAPSTPWTITAKMLGVYDSASVGSGVFYGLVVSDGTKVKLFGQDVQGGIGVWNFTTVTSSGSNVSYRSSPLPMQHTYFKISDDGTTLTFSSSPDGVAWLLIGTQTLSGGFLTSVTQVGFAGATTNSNPVRVAVYYFRKS